MPQLKVTREKYEFRSVKADKKGEEAYGLFAVDLPSGQRRDELLSFTTIEARIRLWEDAVAQAPALSWQDVQGASNYREYIKALVEALRLQVV